MIPYKKIALFDHHHIYLTKKQRYELIEGKEVKVLGISVPIWFIEKNAKTTEPGEEVFCEYLLVVGKNPDINIWPNIKEKRGFKIIIPEKDENYIVPALEDKKVAEMSKEERESYYSLRDKWFENNPEPKTVDMLRDLPDGISELKFEITKESEIPIAKLNASHQIEIKPIELLEETII